MVGTRARPSVPLPAKAASKPGKRASTSKPSNARPAKRQKTEHQDEDTTAETSNDRTLRNRTVSAAKPVMLVKKVKTSPVNLIPTPRTTPKRATKVGKRPTVMRYASDQEDSSDEEYAVKTALSPVKTPVKSKQLLPSTPTSMPRRAAPQRERSPSPATTRISSPSASRCSSTAPVSTPATPLSPIIDEDQDKLSNEDEDEIMQEPEEEEQEAMIEETQEAQPLTSSQSSTRETWKVSTIQSLLESTIDCLYGRKQPYLPLPDNSPSTSNILSFPYLPGMQSYERDLRATLDRTVKEGEGNCLLLVGPRAIGKTTLVERSLHLLSTVEADNFLVVRLSGLVQTTDRLSLREIARQLCSSEGGLDDDGSSFTSNAAILASLLAILEPNPAIISTSDPENLAANTNKSIIFILEEFDLFALRDQRQSFLYCLLDIVQSKRRKGGMAVIGLSARTDCLNTLEKRVKSRCQSRVHQIMGDGSIEQFLEVARCRMKADKLLLTASEEATEEELDSLARAWNQNVDTYLASDGARNMAENIFALSKSRAELLAEVTTSVKTAFKHVSRSVHDRSLPKLQYTPSKSHNTRASLLNLSIVELAMLTAAKHSTIKEPNFNFAIVYDCYRQHIKRQAPTATAVRGYNRDVCYRAYQHLCELELIQVLHVSNRARIALNGPFKMCRLVPWDEHIDAAVNGRADVSEKQKMWNKTWTE